MRGVDRHLEFRPAFEQGLECAFAFDARELVAEAEMDARPEGNVPVRLPLEIEPFGVFVRRRVHVGCRQHGHDLIALFNRTPPSSMSIRTKHGLEN
jgi:hypothetical protein